MRSGRISSKGRLRVSEDRLGDGEAGSARRSAWEPDVSCRAEGGLAALPIERRSVGRATVPWYPPRGRAYYSIKTSINHSTHELRRGAAAAGLSLYGISYEGAAGPVGEVLAPALDSADYISFLACIVHGVLLVRPNADCRLGVPWFIHLLVVPKMCVVWLLRPKMLPKALQLRGTRTPPAFLSVRSGTTRSAPPATPS